MAGVVEALFLVHLAVCRLDGALGEVVPAGEHAQAERHAQRHVPQLHLRGQLARALDAGGQIGRGVIDRNDDADKRFVGLPDGFGHGKESAPLKEKNGQKSLIKNRYGYSIPKYGGYRKGRGAKNTGKIGRTGLTSRILGHYNKDNPFGAKGN